MDEEAFSPACAEEGEASWHYLRTCPTTGETWCALHAAGDRVQWDCPHCGALHTTHPGGARHPFGWTPE